MSSLTSSNDNVIKISNVTIGSSSLYAKYTSVTKLKVMWLEVYSCPKVEDSNKARRLQAMGNATFGFGAVIYN